MNEEIKVGDVVKHKSGGPKMVVRSIEQGKAVCVQMTQEGEHKMSFPVEELKEDNGGVPAM